MHTKLKPTIPPDIKSFFLKPPILKSENLMEYKMVFEALADSLRPANPVEWLLCREVTNLFWDERRLEKLKAAMINTTWQQALVMILESILEGDANERRRAAEVHADSWFKSEEAQRIIADLLRARGLTLDSVSAQAVNLRLPELDYFDRRLERIRLTRMAQLREIEHYRGAGTWQIPENLPQVVDAAATSIVPTANPVGK